MTATLSRARSCGTWHSSPLVTWAVFACILAASQLLWLSRASGQAFRKGPYPQNVSGTSATLMWESVPPRPAVIELRGEETKRIEVPAEEVQEATISGLSPGHRYHYTVIVGDEVATGEFATAPVAGAPFTFIVFGDSRSNVNAHQRVVDRVREEVADLILGTGDMVNEGHSDEDWQAFFEIERDLLRENVYYPSLGNHDRQGRGRTADSYRKYFSLPENSPNPERYYAFTYASARFLILDSNTYSFALSDQTEWIEQQLQAARLDPDIRHIFVTMHHPPFSVSLHGGQEELREAWTPLFEKYQVAAVFSGHDHVYSRAEKNGVRYFVSGGGGAPLYPRKDKSSRIDEEATAYFERVNHHLRVAVFGDFIEIAAVRADGTLIETIAWGQPPKPTEAAALAQLESQKAKRPATPFGSGRHESASVGQGAAAEGEGGLGLFGLVGVAAVLLATLGLVLALRRPG